MHYVFNTAGSNIMVKLVNSFINTGAKVITLLQNMY